GATGQRVTQDLGEGGRSQPGIVACHASRRNRRAGARANTADTAPNRPEGRGSRASTASNHPPGRGGRTPGRPIQTTCSRYRGLFIVADNKTATALETAVEHLSRTTGARPGCSK